VPAWVFLFGSHARGDAKSDSDLDFLFVERGAESTAEEWVRLRDALAPLGVPVDVIVMGQGRRIARDSGDVRQGSSASKTRSSGRWGERLLPERGELVVGEVERVEQADQRRQAWVAQAALDLAEVLLADAGARGQLALAELEHASPLAQRPHDHERSRRRLGHRTLIPPDAEKRRLLQDKCGGFLG
jgi:hypothetical protein